MERLLRLFPCWIVRSDWRRDGILSKSSNALLIAAVFSDLRVSVARSITGTMILCIVFVLVLGCKDRRGRGVKVFSLFLICCFSKA